MINACKACSANELHKIITLYDDRYGYDGQFILLHCKSCGHKQIDFDATEEILLDLYSNYYPRSTLDLDEYKPHKKNTEFKAWLNGEMKSAVYWVPKNVRILDIGCGFGESLGYHHSRGCDVYGVEADENIRRVADKFGYKVHVGLFNPELYESGFFDYITMDQVIEHITNPVETLCGVAKILKPGGIAILSTPNSNGWGAKTFGRRWINWHAPYHIQFFSRKSMQLAAEKAGLKLQKVHTITSSEWLLYQWIHLLTYPKIGEPSIFWANKRSRKLWEKIWLGICHIIHKTKINHLITRFFDALGIGDNYLFFFEKR